jgi:hypothetical protein
MSEPIRSPKTYTELIEELRWTPSGDETGGKNPCPSCMFSKPGNELTGDLGPGEMAIAKFPVRDLRFQFLDGSGAVIKTVSVPFGDGRGDQGDRVSLSQPLTQDQANRVARVAVFSTAIDDERCQGTILVSSG